MIKVLFVYSDKLCECTRKRTIEANKALSEYKVDKVLSDKIYYTELNEEHMRENDIVIFQRTGANGGNMLSDYGNKILKLIINHRDKTKCVYDIDDYVFHRQNDFPIKMLLACNYALAPNKTIEEKMKDYNKNTYIIRTFIDLEKFNLIPKKIKFNESIINIGWISSGGFGIDIMKKIYPSLLKQYDKKIAIHSFSRMYKYIRKDYKEKIIKTYTTINFNSIISAFKCFDFVINPIDFNNLTFNNLIENDIGKKIDFINCKSEIKYLNAGAAGVPIISTPTSSYEYAIENEKNGFLAKDKNDWLKYIDLLIKEKEIRANVGLAAKEDIINNYSLKSAADNYYNFFKKILS